MESNIISKDSNVNKSYYDFMLAKSWLSDGDEIFIDHAKQLLEKGWNLNKQNEHGDTLLHLAVRNNKWKSLEWMIEQGGNCLIQNKHGHTPVWLARRKNNKSFPKIFLEIYFQAEKDGLLVEKKTLIKTQSENENVIEISRPVVTEKSDSIVDKWTEALLNKDEKLAKQLLFAGFELSECNKNGRTPLHEAIFHNEWEMVEYLISYGACVSAKDNSGLSCIDYVESKWNEQEPSLDIDSYEMIKFAIKDEKVAEVLAQKNNIQQPQSSSNFSKKESHSRPYANNKQKKTFKQKSKVNFVMDQNVSKVNINKKLEERMSEKVEAISAPVVIIKKARKLSMK